MKRKSAIPKKKIVIVLGAHRSGTSLLAAGLEKLGACLGLKQHYINNENPKGFFENEEIVGFNDRLLEFLGGHWDNPLFDGRQAISTKSVTALVPWFDEAKKLIRSNFDDRPLIAIKDPRMCQLLPFWEQVFNNCGYDGNNTYYVHIARYPMEVAQSQYKRKQANSEFYCIGGNLLETVSLWFSLSYQSLRDINSDNNIFLLYSDLLNKPKSQLIRLADFLDIEYSEKEINEFCTLFVDKSLRHNIADSEKCRILKKNFPEAIEFFKEQQLLSQKKTFSYDDVQKATSIWHQPNTMKNLLTPLIPFFSGLAIQRLTLNLSKIELEKAIINVRMDRDQVRSNFEDELRKLRIELDKLSMEKDRQIKSLMTKNYHLETDISHYIKLSMEKDRQIKSLMTKNYHLETDIANYIKEIAIIENSLSWCITTPLRWVQGQRIKARKTMSAIWLKVSNHSTKLNQRLKSRSPGLSWVISAVLRPLFKIVTDMALNKPACQILELHNNKSGLLSNGFCSEYQQSATRLQRKPLVSIIVPNYNHAPFLRQRLESIYSQTYDNYEVILLDDCSSDESRQILEYYCSYYPEKTRIIFNKTNSGGVFYQWGKGFSAASGDLIWIAESDDWCMSNFLDTLIKYFDDEAVMLAYCRTTFMDGEGKKQVWSLEEYLSDIDTQLWQSSFVRTAHQIVNSAWAIKNIIPNVSSVIFKNPGRMELLKNDKWKQMRICGDWLFYLHIIRGGLVAFSPDTTNYYRIHGSNTSVATYANDAYYIEHEVVAKHINRLYTVPDHIFTLQREAIKQHWIRNRPTFSDEELDRLYNVNVIRETSKARKANLLMASYGFTAGGGETFPIMLANLFKGYGYSVTFLTCDQEVREEELRRMLRGDIPVVNNFSLLHKITLDFNIDIIHSHHAWVDNTILDSLPEDCKCQTVVSLHGMYETIADKDLKKILPRLLSKTGKMVYAAEKNLEPFKKHGLFEEKKFAKIGNALDIFPITPTNLKELGIPEDAFVLCLVSRAIHEKGWKEAVESVRLAREHSEKDIHLLLIGEGPAYDYFLENGHPSYVHLLGFRKNIRDYYAASDMGYLPSRFTGESFPLTVIDCLHSGKPVLASDVGEIRNMLEGNGKLAGCLFLLKNWKIPVSHAAEIIARCATDRSYYEEIKQAVPIAAEKFDPITMLNKYDVIYADLIGSRKEVLQRKSEEIKKVQSI